MELRKTCLLYNIMTRSSPKCDELVRAMIFKFARDLVLQYGTPLHPGTWSRLK